MAGEKEMKKEKLQMEKNQTRQAGEGGVRIERGSEEREVQISVLRCSDSLVVTFIHSKYRW